MFESADWSKLFAPDTPMVEIFARGTLMYLGVIVLLRVISKRVSGSIGIPDLLLITLLADAAQNGMADDYASIVDGLLLVGVIVFWSFMLDLLSYKFPFVHRLLHPPALKLVVDGKPLSENLKKELMTEDDLAGKLRLNGVDDAKMVKCARMEAEGGISVIKEE